MFLPVLDLLSTNEKTLVINLITSVGFFLISGVALYFCSSLSQWCRYGRETLGLIAMFVFMVGVIRVLSIVSILSVADARLVNGCSATGFFIGIMMTVYLHHTVHATRQENGLPPTDAAGVPGIPALSLHKPESYHR